MKFMEDFTITDDTYDQKHYEVYLTHCNLTVLSYDLGRALTLKEIFEDEDLMQTINEYLYHRIRST